MTIEARRPLTGKTTSLGQPAKEMAARPIRTLRQDDRLAASASFFIHGEVMPHPIILMEFDSGAASRGFLGEDGGVGEQKLRLPHVQGNGWKSAEPALRGVEGIRRAIVQ